MEFTQSSLENPQGLTASGTFQFQKTDSVSSENKVKTQAIAIADIVAQLPEDAVILCKVDIEGGEEYLFAENTQWMKRMTFLTLELHDRFAPGMLRSSSPVLKAILDYDFAVQPDRDVLLCYARSLVKS